MRHLAVRGSAAALVACLAVAALSATVGGQAGAASTAVQRPEGAGPPVKASGMGTGAALDNPRCSTDAQYGPYGRFDTSVVGGGAPCVKAWDPSKHDNGGATSPGVTADRVRVVVVLANAQQAQSDPVKPINRTTTQTGTLEDALHDYLLPQMRFYETWGRDVDVVFYTSTGTDEQAQRADAVAIKALEPFAALVPFGGVVLEAELATAKIVVNGLAATPDSWTKQAPYRWTGNDNYASALNSAEVMGKQLAGKKANRAGDALQGETRKFGVVMLQDLIDYTSFVATLKKNGGTVTADATLNLQQTSDLQVQAPTAINRMKSAGVTTIATFADYNSLKTLMEAATQQDYYPEWFITGAQYQDISILARGYPKEQSVHSFGISFIAPWVTPDPATTDQIDPMSWYWGPKSGTATSRWPAPVAWLLSGIHAAGPELTPKTFSQGLFATPATGGAASENPGSSMTGWGRQAKLPYDQRASMGYDFAPVWWDNDTEGPSNGTGTVGKGVLWFAGDAQRYVATTWPTKPIKWFDESTSIIGFDTRPGAALEPVGACIGCPSSGGPGTPGAPSDTEILFQAGGTRSSAA